MDLSTSLAGFRLAHPFMAGASPLGWNRDSVRQLEDAGCAALVLPSLFEEQITMTSEGRIRHMDVHEQLWRTWIDAFPDERAYHLDPHSYAEHVSRVKRAVRIPVFGSLNGTTGERWLEFSRVIEQAGADGLEVNRYQIVTTAMHHQ